MDESFWFLSAEDDAERPAESGLPFDLRSDYAPFQESMRGDRRHTHAPSTDQKKVRRQIHRSGSFWDSEGIKPHERVTDWDSVVGDQDTSDWRIHRTVHIDPMEDPDGFNLWKGMGHNPVKGSELPDHEVAHRLLKLVTQHPHLGLHWTADENHAYRVGGTQSWGHGHSWYSGQEQGYHERSGLESPVVVHARWPKNHHIETDPDELHRYGVKPFDNPDLDEHNEAEVPMKTGAPVEITGVSWSGYTSNRKGEYRHHTFDKPIRHTAGNHHTATVLNTQIERLNPGDSIRTPTGQTSEVKQIRPHETDSTLMYLDTDMGTSTVKRGTDFQIVPHNSQQQELPNTGNMMGGGNAGALPGQGKSPGGTSPGQQGVHKQTCPNCGSTAMELQGSAFMCRVCGFSAGAGNTPGNLMFGDKPHGYMPSRRQPGEVPTAHVWASKYTDQQGSQIARRARQVLGGEQ
jgi:hypothetical protein